MNACAVNFIPAIVLSLIFSNMSFAADNAEDDQKFSENRNAILDIITDTSDAHTRALTYFYVGPLAWSRPEARITIDRGPGARINFIELAVHSEVVAAEMTDHGDSDARKAMRAEAKYAIDISVASCPRASAIGEELARLALEQSGKELRGEDSRGRVVMLDGGWSHHFHFGTAGLNEYAYVAYQINAMTDKVKDLKSEIISCDPAASRAEKPKAPSAG